MKGNRQKVTLLSQGAQRVVQVEPSLKMTYKKT